MFLHGVAAMSFFTFLARICWRILRQHSWRKSASIVHKRGCRDWPCRWNRSDEIDQSLQNPPYFCFYFIVIREMQWQGSYRRKVGKETHHLRISQAFTRVDYRKAVNKENLGTPKLAQRSLHCKDAKPLRFLLQALYSFMRRVASVSSTGRGFQNQVIDSMAT